MGRPKKPDASTVQLSVRISDAEKATMDKLIARAERSAGQAAGTITSASYARSALLDYMSRELARIEEKTTAERPTAWDRLMRADEILDGEGGGKKGRGR